ESATIGAVRHAPHPVLVPGEGAEHAPGGGVPELDGVVGTGGGEGAAIGTIRHAHDGSLVPAQGAEFTVGDGVPDLDRTVMTGRGEDAAVGAEGHAPNNPVVPAQGAAPPALTLEIVPLELARIGILRPLRRDRLGEVMLHQVDAASLPGLLSQMDL